MFKFKNPLNPPQKVEAYDSFSDYLKSDTLPIYQEVDAGQPLIHIGNVPRIIEQLDDADDTIITIKYPFIPLIREYKNDHNIQFNGTDLYLSQTKATEENLYIPLTVITHFADLTVTSRTMYRVMVEYGETVIQHKIPCQKIAEQAVNHQLQRHPVLKDEHDKSRLHVSRWEFTDGELHVYATLVPTILSKLEMGVQKLNIRYTPQPTWIMEDSDQLLHLTISEDEIQYIIAQTVSLDKYDVNYKIINENGIDSIILEKKVKVEYFPEEYKAIKPFVEYLNDLGYYIDDEILYDYFEQVKFLGGELNG